MTEFYVQHGGLNLVQTAVATLVFKNVFLFRSVVGEGAYGVGKFLVVGSHGTAVAKGSEVFSRVERVACGVAQRTSF